MRRSRLLIAGAHSGVGKTSVSAGLMSALTQQNLTVQPWKVGPDYIDPAFHSFVTGRQSRNLDAWMLPEETLKALFLANAPLANEGLSIIEGVMGLFDGHISDGTSSSAHVAQILAAPTVLIINGASIARSAAAMVHGYNHFLPDFRLAGVIINMVSSASHYQLLKNFVEKEAGVPCFGYLKKNPGLRLESRHLGLVPSVEVDDLTARLALLAEEAASTLDLAGLIKLAESAPEISSPAPQVNFSGEKIRLGIAKDQAFNFYYQDGLDFLDHCGAELIPFSPISDNALPPDLDGLYFGGGFPEMFAAELESNAAMRSAVKSALENGLPAYAECGGLMYLGHTLTDHDGRTFAMTDFFPHDTIMTKQLQNFGYVEVTFDQPTVLGPAGTAIRAHEFHHSKIIGPEPEYALNIVKSQTRGWRGGVVKKNVLAAYPHLHFYANPDLAVNFVSNCRKFKESG